MKISVVIEALTGSFETDMNRAAKTAEKRMREIERSAKVFGAVIGAGLVVGVAAIARATIEAEKVQAQLAARIKDTGMAAGRTVEQLNKMADSLQGRTVFDDEAIGGAQAMLLTFKQIQGVQFDATIEAAADLATVMGTDIADAAKLLGKALTEPEEGFGALKKAGVVFTQGQQDAIKAMVEAGDKAGAQDAILRELATTMGTAAEAAANTLGGSLTNLVKTFENLLEGDTKGEGVRGTVEAINALGEIMRSPGVKDGFQTMIAGLASITATAVNAIAQLANMAGTIKQNFTTDSEKSYQGLLEKRLALEEKIGKLPKFVLLDIGGARGKLEAELKALDVLIAQRRALAELGTNNGALSRGHGRQPSATPLADAAAEALPAAAGGGSRAAAAIRDTSDAAERAAREVDDFLRTLGDLRAEQEGPAAQALLRYNRAMEESNEFLAAHPEMVKAVTEAHILLKQQLDEELPSIEATAAALMKLNAAGMEGKDAEKWLTDSQLAGIDAADNMRESMSNAIVQAFKERDVLGAIESFGDSLASTLQRRLADSLTDLILGPPGTPMGGSGGGLLSGLLGLIPGFANGTDYAPGGMAWVGERGPELVNLPRGSQVIPADKSARMGGGHTINITVAGNTTKETAQQIAGKVSQALAFAQRAS